MTQSAAEPRDQAREVEAAQLSPHQAWSPPPREQSCCEQPQLRLVPTSSDQASDPVIPVASRSVGAPPAVVTSDLDSELQAAREELHALHELLEQLPAIFERKFQQRLQMALRDQRQLLAENQDLRHQLAGVLPPGSLPIGQPSPRLLLPPALERASSLGQTLRQVLRRSRTEAPALDRDGWDDGVVAEAVASAETAGSAELADCLSPGDVARPRAAWAGPKHK
jgi:hypothetical protein